MSETTVDPSAADEVSAAASENPAAAPEESAEEALSVEKAELSIRTLLEAGAHFGHLTQRWDPRMRHYIFGARNGTHILDLDQTLPLFREALSFLEDIVAGGGHVLFVGTKRQAADIVRREALRSGQYYVNNRWLGGMLTNWKTVKKSIESYKGLLEILGDEEKRAEYSKKELSRIMRLCEKYQKSLEGIKEMQRVPDAMFVIDVSREDIAITEARRLGIPIIAIVDSNCSPRGIDFVIPGNDDATRAIDLYCRCVADRCLEGANIHQQQLLREKADQPADQKPKATTGRRVVEIKQAPRRSRGASGRTHTSGGWGDKRGGEATGGEEPSGGASAQAPKAPAAPAAPETEEKSS